MAIYRARWVNPMTGRPMFREFHSKPEAMAFRDLPRDHLVFIDLPADPLRLSGLHRRKSDGL